MNRSDIIDRVAVALWNITRRELQGVEEEPAFVGYADGRQEPMPFHLQDAEFRRYWRQRARRVIRAVLGPRKHTAKAKKKSPTT